MSTNHTTYYGYWPICTRVHDIKCDRARHSPSPTHMYSLDLSESTVRLASSSSSSVKSEPSEPDSHVFAGLVRVDRQTGELLLVISKVGAVRARLTCVRWTCPNRPSDWRAPPRHRWSRNRPSPTHMYSLDLSESTARQASSSSSVKSEPSETGTRGERRQPRATYDVRRPQAARRRPRYGGDAFIGREMYSGWYWTATKYGWSAADGRRPDD